MDTAYCDGACEPVNPGGTGGWGFIIKDEAGNLLTSGYGALEAGPEMTNNVAEYMSGAMCVKAYRQLGRPGPLLIRGDSKLMVMQMRGEWKVKAGAYVKVYRKLKDLVAACTFQIQWEWVPREQNGEADELSKKGILEVGGRIQDRRPR
jgi:ribonuclease HI